MKTKAKPPSPKPRARDKARDKNICQVAFLIIQPDAMVRYEVRGWYTPLQVKAIADCLVDAVAESEKSKL